MTAADDRRPACGEVPPPLMKTTRMRIPPPQSGMKVKESQKNDDKHTHNLEIYMMGAATGATSHLFNLIVLIFSAGDAFR